MRESRTSGSEGGGTSVLPTPIPARYVTFQMAEVAVPRKLFREILQRIARLKSKRISLAPG